MSSEAPEPTVVDDAPPVEHHEGSGASEDDADESEPEAPIDLMVTSRARRSNAGNRMSTLLAQQAEEEEWGEEWEEVANEEEFRGGDVNEQEDYNMDSSSSEEDSDAAAAAADDDDAGEKELRKAERQERTKKRKIATNPFAARLATAARKKVKIDVPRIESTSSAPVRPKKKSERASWIPTEEDGPIRTSSRRQTVANKESTLAKLQEKDRRRDDTLAMMKAAEARKKKDEPKPLTQAERLAEAARQERINKKTLHRWEEAEEVRAAERQAKIDALKNRQIEGPFIRYYSGPAIYVDDKLRYTGKDAPTLGHLEEKLNKEPAAADTQITQPEPTERTVTAAAADPQTPHHDSLGQHPPPMSSPEMFSVPASQSLQQDIQLPWAAGSQAANGDVFMGGDLFMGSSHGMSSYNSTITFAPPQNQDSFLFGIDQYASTQNQQNPTPSSDLPPNPFPQSQSFPQYTTSSTFSPHPSLSDALLTQENTNIGPQALLLQSQRPALAPQPPRRKIIKRAMRNLLILSSFPNLDAPPTSSRARTAASMLKDKDRAALIQLCKTLFEWNEQDATTFVNNMLLGQAAKTQKAREAHDAAIRPTKQLCAVTNAVARYRDPETGIAYRDARAFGVLRGVVGGGFVWSGDLGCYVGGRAKPLESMGGKGFLGMPPAAGVPRRFLEMSKKSVPVVPPLGQAQTPVNLAGPVTAPAASAGGTGASKTEELTVAV
ncbi:YL1-domain-containing protein [Macroventuria anomochaeta]|uniref:YL1-domain-containing protein n=1 Tax=Macroventuria anomochaeta TaxID=301207 RepID=A0ACB6S5Y5_9PLEO|nr:YL1-domain-containing protein [Macroventuria anomochaeta]KAF2629383.1 YL1-domain-containing protein [Macroventuria anomochaeta]